MPELTITEDTTPAQIVAGLHAKIAAKSPQHAALVVAFEQIAPPRRRGFLQARTSRVTPDRLRRMAVYSGARLAGMSVKAAARRAGIKHCTGYRYEADFLAAMGGVV